MPLLFPFLSAVNLSKRNLPNVGSRNLSLHALCPVYGVDGQIELGIKPFTSVLQT